MHAPQILRSDNYAVSHAAAQITWCC